MKSTLIYSLKVWLTAVVLAPMLTQLLDYLCGVQQSYDLKGIFYFVLLSIPYGLMLSLPCWLLLWLATSLLNRTRLTNKNKKLLLSVVGFLLAALPFYLIFGHDDKGFNLETIVWAASYMLVIVAGVWAYKLSVVTNVSL